jgi:predicted TIM-barrel fold metal-dependent hydrolase
VATALLPDLAINGHPRTCYLSILMSGLSAHAITQYGLIGGCISAILAGVFWAKWQRLRALDRNLETNRTSSIYALAAAVSIGLSVLCLAMALVAHRSTRIRQSDAYVLDGAALVEFSSLEPIDAHTHVTQSGPAFIGMLERMHVHVLDILYVDDNDPFRSSLERQRQGALNFVASGEGHVRLCTTFDPYQLNDPDFVKVAIDGLNRDFEHGAVAAKVWKNIGMEIKNKSGQYVMPDDAKFEPIYKDIASQGKTLISHLAEPDAAWESHDPKSPYARYYAANPQWDMSKKPGAPTKNEILQARDRLLSMNRDLRVVGAHLGNLEDDLEGLSMRLDRYPNFAVDTAARVLSLVIQPRDKVRAFVLKYQDRILYGTDLRFESGNTDEAASHAWERKYALDWRYFATDDTFDYQGHKVEGLNLPRAVLKKLYHDNAVNWIPGIDTSVR